MPPRRASARCAARSAPPYYAPELPPEVMRIILAKHAGDVATLCAAACVSRSWHAAALEPRLWWKIDTRSGAATVAAVFTDERLALLVRRACGVDAGGKARSLSALDVSGATELTLRGVLKALLEPRNAAGAPLLLGALHQLCVRNVRCSVMDCAHAAKRLSELRSLVAPSPKGAGARGLDVSAVKGCTRELCGVPCRRLAFRSADECDQCGATAALSDGCWPSRGEALCEHMCFGCLGYNYDNEPLDSCPHCKREHGPAALTHRNFCEDCMFFLQQLRRARVRIVRGRI